MKIRTRMSKFKLVKVKPLFITSNKKVYAFRLANGYYKHIGFGERAEFRRKSEANKYLRQINKVK